MTPRPLATGCVLVLSMSVLTCAFVPCAQAAPHASSRATRAPKRPTTAKLTALSAPAPPLAPSAPLTPSAPLAPTATLAAIPPLSLATDADRAPSLRPALEHRATVTLNPLALAIGRYGANAEYVFARHHAITASGYLQTFPQAILRRLLPDIPLGDGPVARLGGELGYRLYSGTDGPTGVFVGPSVVAMPLAAPRLASDFHPELVSFMAYGASLDVGVQAVVGPGLTLGGGVGVMALAYALPTSAIPPAGIELPSYPAPHVLPRLLVAAGWAF